MGITISNRNRRQAALCALCLVLTAPTLASPSTGKVTTHSVAVNYSDLNLNSAAGVKKLYARLRGAARKVCSTPGALQVMELRTRERECQRTAIANAVDSLKNERLAAMHRQRTERPSG